MKNEVVPKIKIWLLQLLFTLMFLLLSFESWSTILAHPTAWEPTRAAAWCMWGGYSIIALLVSASRLKCCPSCCLKSFINHLAYYRGLALVSRRYAGRLARRGYGANRYMGDLSGNCNALAVFF
jgi:hypothetical protein